MKHFGILACGFLASCLAHAPESVAGPDTVALDKGELGAPVLVHEDQWGIPHVRAESMEDAYFVLGWLHAEERMWQMDLQRRIGYGRLSELFGKRTIEADRYLRTLGMRGAAEGMLAEAPPEVVAVLDAYSAGVNAAQAQMERPAEYKILGGEPQPWAPLDSVVWLEVMSLQLATDYRDEVMRAKLEAALGPDKAALFLPGVPSDAPRILEDSVESAAEPRGATSGGGPKSTAESETDSSAQEAEPDDAVDAGLAMVDELLPPGPGLGSNSWVLGPTRSSTGRPIVANDPHLGVGVPSVWYLAEIHAPGHHVIGATLPGVPAVIIGHNEHVAWGLTNGYVDVQDLYYEDPQDDEITERVELIEVKRGKDVELVVRESPRGPLVGSYIGLENEARPVSLAWPTLRAGDRTLHALTALARASDCREFRESLADFGGAPQNFVFADDQGCIGYQLAGRVPRRAGHDGSRPIAASDPNGVWTGYYDLDELPGAIDPAAGRVVTANNDQDSNPESPRFTGAFGYRAKRIVDVLDAHEKWGVADNVELQLDVTPAQAQELRPRLIRIEGSDERQRRALEVLRAWDGAFDVDAAAPPLWTAWMIAIVRRLGVAHLGEELGLEWAGGRGVFLREVFLGGQADLCRIDGADDCDAVARLALDDALDRLEKEMGSDLASWRWGDVHAIAFHHQLALFGPWKKKLDTRVEAPGGWWTVNVASHSSRSFTAVHYPSYRQVVDVGNWNESRWIHAPGQSGVHYRDHYRDLAHPHVAGEALPMLFGEAATSASVRTRTFGPR